MSLLCREHYSALNNHDLFFPFPVIPPSSSRSPLPTVVALSVSISVKCALVVEAEKKDAFPVTDFSEK